MGINLLIRLKGIKAKTEHYNKNGWRVINIYPDELKDTNKLINKIKNILQQ